MRDFVGIDKSPKMPQGGSVSSDNSAAFQITEATMQTTQAGADKG